MNAIALPKPPTLPMPGLLAPIASVAPAAAAAATPHFGPGSPFGPAAPVSPIAPGRRALPAPPAALAAGLALAAAQGVAQTTALLRAACQRGQLEDASAAARVHLPRAVAKSPHQALLRALAGAQPTLMLAPDENRLYLLRGADGAAQGLLRLRDNGHIGLAPPAGAARWSLQAGQLVLADQHGQPSVRFALCGEHAGHRLYLGQAVADGAPQLLQELRCTHARLSALDPELAEPFFGLYGIDAMVPAALPARPVLLLAAPHSGSAALRAALNRCDQVAIDGELLHPQAICGALGSEPGAGGAGLAAPPRSTLYQARAKDPAWFVRMMMGRSHDGRGADLAALPVRGFTLAPTQCPPVLDWALAEPALRIVHLVRSNLLAEFADLLADAPGLTPPAAALATAAAGLHFEAARFLRFVDMKQRHLASLRQRLVQRDGDTVELDASRLTDASVAELLGFLLDGPASIAPPVARPGPPPAPVIARFDNPAAVAACLASLGRPGWADAEDTLPDRP